MSNTSTQREYTAIIDGLTIDSRKSWRTYEYCVACKRGAGFIAGKIASLTKQIAELEARKEAANSAVAAGKENKDSLSIAAPIYLDAWIKGCKTTLAAHQNDGEFWVVVGYCGNEALANTLYRKECAPCPTGLRWDDVRIVKLVHRDIKARKARQI